MLEKYRLLKQSFIVGILLTFLPLIANAYEVNTHQAITRCAITDKCSSNGKVRSENLDNFVKKDALLDQENYGHEVYEDYGDYYLHYASKTFEEVKIRFNHSNSYIDLIEAGSVLEDALWPGSDVIAAGGDGRFSSHFYDPQQGGKKLGVGYGQRVNAITWAIDGATLGTDTFAGTRSNHYHLEAAFEYYRQSFSLLTVEERRDAQAKLFVSIGHMAHLIHDMHSPAHTRDDSHPSGDDLEAFASDKRGFNLENGSSFSGGYKNQILSDVRGTAPINYSTYSGYFLNEANFVGKNFFSVDTIFPIIGFSHPLPSMANLSLELIDPEDTRSFYLNSDLVTPSKLAIFHHGWFYDSYSMEETGNSSVLQDNSRTLIPRAVASTEGFINYFFRGRIKAEVTADGDGIEITNISNPDLVADASLTTFNTGGRFDVYYETETGEHKLLLSEQMLGTLSVDETFTLSGLSSAIENAADFGGKIIVLFDGIIGNEIDQRGLAVTQLQIGKVTVSINGSDSIAEQEIRENENVITLTLTGTQWVDAGPNFDAIRQDIINGFVSEQAETSGWNVEVRDSLDVTNVVRTSDLIVTITIPLKANYDITRQEIITVTVPNSSLNTSASSIISVPIISIDAVSGYVCSVQGFRGQIYPRSNEQSKNGHVILSFVTSGLVLDMTDAHQAPWYSINTIEKIFTYPSGNVQVIGYPGGDYPEANYYPDVFYYEMLEMEWGSGVFAAEGYKNGDEVVIK